MFNFSREYPDILVPWKVAIRRRVLLIPSFEMINAPDDPQNQGAYRGFVRITGKRMVVYIWQISTHKYDANFIVFKAPRQPITARVGFLAGFDEEDIPYVGTHLLCSNKITE